MTSRRDNTGGMDAAQKIYDAWVKVQRTHRPEGITYGGLSYTIYPPGDPRPEREFRIDNFPLIEEAAKWLEEEILKTVDAWNELYEKSVLRKFDDFGFLMANDEQLNILAAQEREMEISPNPIMLPTGSLVMVLNPKLRHKVRWASQTVYHASEYEIHAMNWDGELTFPDINVTDE